MLRQEAHRLQAGRLDEGVQPRVQEHVEQVRQELRTLEARLWQHLQAHEDLQAIWQRLQTMVGIGPLTAAAVLAQVGDLGRFDDVRALVSLAGLAVKQGDSGSSVHRRPLIDRPGRSDLRRLLYMCALVAMRHDPAKVVIVAVMRKLLHIIYGVWKSEQDYDPQIAFAATPAA